MYLTSVTLFDANNVFDVPQSRLDLAGLFTNPRTGARSSVSPSAAGGDVREERLLHRFSPERKAITQQLQAAFYQVESKS